ncbi:hypothetical protein ES703_95541 [subsurface metagenome]
MKRVGYPSDVISIAQCKQGEKANSCMFYSVYTPHKVKIFIFHHVFNHILDLYPQPHGLKCLGWKIKREGSDQFLTRNSPFFIASYCFSHLKLAELYHKLSLRLTLGNLDDLSLLF